MRTKEEIRKYRREWCKKNLDKCYVYQERWRKKNPEKWYAISHKKRHRIITKKQKMQSKSWYYKNKIKWKQYRKNSQARGLTPRHYRNLYRKHSLEFLGGKCVKCGFSDTRALQIDHIKGGGSKELKGSCTHKQYLRIKANPKLYQLLCANCNWIKRVERHEYKKEKIYASTKIRRKSG